MPYKARLDRWDIYNNLPSGGHIKLSNMFDCNRAYITMVLQGKRRDTKGIIKAAEEIAAINVWKTRFCKVAKSQL